MSSVPMPRDLSEEAVAEWMCVNSDPFNESRVPWGGLYDGERNKWRFLARAVRALVDREVAKERASTREKVREAVMLAQTIDQLDDEPWHFAYSHGSIVARVMGDHPSNASGGHDEGRPAREEAPRG